MNSIKDLKNYAITLMKIGANLLETAEVLEREVKDEVPPEYNYLYCKANKGWRERVLKDKYGIKMSYEEERLWKKIMKEVQISNGED